MTSDIKSHSVRLGEGQAHSVRFLDDATLLAATESGALVRVPIPQAATGNSTTTAAPGGITALAASADGTRLATAETSHVIGIYDTATGRRVDQLSPDGLAHAVAWLPDKRVAFGGEMAKVELIDPKSRNVQVFGLHTPWVSALALSPDGNTLASGAGNATVKLWDLATAKELATLTGHRAQIGALAYLSADRLITVSRDRRVAVWNVPERKAVATLKAHDSAVVALALSGPHALTGGENGELYVWTPPAEKPLHKWPAAQGAVTALAITNDGAHAIVADATGTVTWRRFPDGAIEATAAFQADQVTAIRTDANTVTLATARGSLLLYR